MDLEKCISLLSSTEATAEEKVEAQKRLQQSAREDEKRAAAAKKQKEEMAQRVELLQIKQQNMTQQLMMGQQHVQFLKQQIVQNQQIMQESLGKDVVPPLLVKTVDIDVAMSDVGNEVGNEVGNVRNEVGDEIENDGVPAPSLKPVESDVAMSEGEFYVEEMAWKHHNPPAPVKGKDIPGAVSFDDLPPLPQAPPLPEIPNTGKCKWTFDETSRVLLGNFIQDNGSVEIATEDERFLLRMMERDDITCVSDGLATKLDPEFYSLRYFVNVIGGVYFHKFRCFDEEKTEEEEQVDEAEEEELVNRTQIAEADANDVDMEELAETIVTCKYKEVDVSLSMKVLEFARYVSMRLEAEAVAKMNNGDMEAVGPLETEFHFLDHEGKPHVIDVRKTVLYMIDFDIVKLLPKPDEALRKNFELPGCLPGGLHCMMNSMSVHGRPFMGPNGYYAPPGVFTQVHQDGHGTVDSGHLCLSGYQEVVMLRRMPGRYKRHALQVLFGGVEYDGLYDLPHGDNLGEKPDWPIVDGIEECARMNMYPSVFILFPGQLVHINKGRLHALRKMSLLDLALRDCHAKLRSDLKASIDTTNPAILLCFSIAWDWMFRGVTSEGICREVVSTLECASLNWLHGRKSLGIPETALLQMACTLTPALQNPSPPCASNRIASMPKECRFVPSNETILRGILPALRALVHQHVRVGQEALATQKALTNEEGQEPEEKKAKQPDSWEDPQVSAINPYDIDGYFCMICHKEMSNVYLHCSGCNELLKDFNICPKCYSDGSYKVNIQMNPRDDKMHSHTNHTGKFAGDKKFPCKTKKCFKTGNKKCTKCGFCDGCSCKCHKIFEVHRRFFTEDEELALVARVEAVVGNYPPIPFSDEVEPRLRASALSTQKSTQNEVNTGVSASATAPPEMNGKAVGRKKRKGGKKCHA